MRDWSFVLRIALGLVIALLLGWGFVEVGEAVSTQFINTIDTNILTFIEQRRSDAITPIAKAFTFLGSTGAYLILGIPAFVMLWIRGRRFEAVMLAVVAVGASDLTVILKAMYHRPRPDILPLVTETTFSFPSGHTLSATAFYGFLAYFNTRQKLWYWHVAGWMIFAVLVIGVGWSRVYLGIHWPTDVIGGFLAGAAWLIACISAYHVLCRFPCRS